MFVCLFSSRIWSTCGFWAGTVWFILDIFRGSALFSFFEVCCFHRPYQSKGLKCKNYFSNNFATLSQDQQYQDASHFNRNNNYQCLQYYFLSFFSLKIALTSYSPGTCQWGPWKENIISCQVVCQLNYWTRNSQLSLNYSTWLASRELHTVQW